MRRAEPRRRAGARAAREDAEQLSFDLPHDHTTSGAQRPLRRLQWTAPRAPRIGRRGRRGLRAAGYLPE